ncbi:DUF6256 family protein [Streptomyces profundus]|uniref:DUF6256 family protein n=1 Tax=Streptomyces profundus TaxID=2867410 RepID=UPI001D16D0B9|nr:DUF6256 family protein [Streptomyces sp. MA3_2.13]UED87698.1 hypothetical protein K4G22_28800 [Streptomyces sp. MA3_2.13]
MRPPTALVLSMTTVGYLLLMAALAVGLRLRRAGARPEAGRRGWPALLRRVAGTVLGGWALLVVVLAGYYVGLARLGGPFLLDGLTGAAALLAVVLPLFALASWLVERRHRRHARREPAAQRDRDR